MMANLGKRATSATYKEVNIIHGMVTLTTSLFKGSTSLDFNKSIFFKAYPRNIMKIIEAKVISKGFIKFTYTKSFNKNIKKIKTKFNKIKDKNHWKNEKNTIKLIPNICIIDIYSFNYINFKIVWDYTNFKIFIEII
jgi:hypothetical protein